MGEKNRAKTENGSPEGFRDENVDLTKPITQFPKEVILLRKKQAELSKMGQDFLSLEYDGVRWPFFSAGVGRHLIYLYYNYFSSGMSVFGFRSRKGLYQTH